VNGDGEHGDLAAAEHDRGHIGPHVRQKRSPSRGDALDRERQRDLEKIARGLARARRRLA
jgi:hypothetical protein